MKNLLFQNDKNKEEYVLKPKLFKSRIWI